MFGSDFASHPEILTQSLQEMNSQYGDGSDSLHKFLLRILQSIYIKVFGIPEIGFQVRGLYFRKALKYIRNFSPERVLDVGSGIGVFVFYLSKLFPEALVDGWEIDKQKINYTTDLKKEFCVDNSNFVYRDIIVNNTEKSIYDFIVTIDVLEHIKNYKKALENIYALLKPKAYLYIHIPQEKQKRFFSEFRSWEHEDHVRVGFNPKDFIKELKRMGYKIVLEDYTFGYFGSLAWELNHKLLKRSLVLAGIAYPFLYLLSLLDIVLKNNYGLGVSILARK